MSAAEELRAAAALMRERATKAAAEDIWEAFRQFNPALGRDIIGVTEGNEASVFEDSLCRPEDAEHIASWHPAVALAVADWLDREAEGIESGNWRPCVESALAVARTYLRTP